MRNRIFGAIGVLWGGAILIAFFIRGGLGGAGAYRIGQMIGLAFGALLFVVGLFYLVKTPQSRQVPRSLEENESTATTLKQAVRKALALETEGDYPAAIEQYQFVIRLAGTGHPSTAMARKRIEELESKL
jgi:hypothetical protein